MIQAVAYCGGLALEGGGWRLPRLDELRSLVDYARAGPAIDPALFPGTPSENFWTASPFARTPGSAWYVYFDDGFAGYNVTTSPRTASAASADAESPCPSCGAVGVAGTEHHRP